LSILITVASPRVNSANWKEIRSLALFSYRHFALRRMLAALDSGD
jgi:hypothetical protein